MKLSLFVVVIITQIMNIMAIPMIEPYENRIAKNILTIIPMRDGGGYPSTNDGMPSGGGRWND